MARPSRPSVRFTALLVPTITSQIQGMRNIPTSGRKFLKKGTESLLVAAPRRSKCRMSQATSSEMAVRSAIFCQLVRPRFCFLKSFCASSKAPTVPKPSRAISTTQMAPLLRSHQSRVETMITARMRMPPMVGVPAFFW